MAFVKNTIHDRIIVHCSQKVIDVVEIKAHAGFRAEDFLFGCASAEPHDRSAVLLSHCTLRIKKVTDIISTNDARHFDQAGFRVHLYFDKGHHAVGQGVPPMPLDQTLTWGSE